MLALFAEAYPRDDIVPNHLRDVSQDLGDFRGALAEAQEALKLSPGQAIFYYNLASVYLNLDRLDEARASAMEAQNLGAPIAYGLLYQIDFLQHDAAGMDTNVTALMGKPGYEDIVLGQESDTAGYAGKFARARELTRRAAASAKRAGEQEAAAGYLAWAALRDALVGNLGMARRQAQAGLAFSQGRDVEAISAIALALAGDAGNASRLAGDLTKRFPADTFVQIEYLPTIQGGTALSSGKQARSAAKAIEALAVVAQYKLGAFPLGYWGTPLCHIYLLGEGYLAAGQGTAAAAEFQKILDHPGVVMNFVTGALAHLGLGRAYALADDDVKARTAYQDFLALWRDADPDIPVLKQARAEYAKLR